MIRVDNMSLVSSYTKQMTMKFDFSYDNGTPLPINTYTMGTTIYTIANGSTATNLKNGRTYVYDNGKWNINLTKSNTPNTSKTITNNGNYSIVNNDTFGMNNVKVNVSGGSSPTPSVGSRSDVNFYDYDGAIVNSYTKDEFLALSAMPENPTHEGLTAQGWNWDLEDAKTYVTDYGKLEIGQVYASDTPNGNTLLHIKLGDGRLKPYLGLTGNGEGTTVSIDWGDGSTSESVTLNTSTVYTPHEYTNSGEYIITISVTSGSISLNGNSDSSNLFRKSSSENANDDRVYSNILTKAEIGTGVTSIGSGAFNACYSLTSITIPSSVTSIGNNAFQDCRSLNVITIPSSVTTIGNQAFQNCFSLTSITIPSSITSIVNEAFNSCYSLTLVTISSSVTSIGNNAFQNCYSLTLITIPSSVTSIGSGAFYICYSLTSVIIPSSVTIIENSAFNACYSLTSITIPPSVTSIGNQAFQDCRSLNVVTIPSSVTTIGSSAFQNCYSLTSVTIPSSVTSIGSGAFYSCYSLTSITIPPSVTSIGNQAFRYCFSLTSITISSSVTTIGESIFQYCYSLTSITIPSSVTTIDSSAFNTCYGLGYIKFSSTTPPSVWSANAWTNIPTDCIIYVPTGSLSAYKSASRYPSSSTYTYEEYTPE